MKLFGPYKKRSRSASMQLSINAIVILVMAMAVLGIGLGLIRGVLGKGKNKLSDSLDAMDLSEPASSEKPLTNINNLKIKRNSEEAIKIGFYNADNDCSGDNGATLNITCVRHGVSLNWDDFSIIPTDIGQGESKSIGAIVKTGADAGIYPCNIKVFCGSDNNGPILAESASTTIEITS